MRERLVPRPFYLSPSAHRARKRAWVRGQQFHCGHLAGNCYVDSDLRYTHELFIPLPQGREKYRVLSPPKFLDPISFCSNINQSTDLSKLIPILQHIKNCPQLSVRSILYHQYTTTRENPNLVGHLCLV